MQSLIKRMTFWFKVDLKMSVIRSQFFMLLQSILDWIPWNKNLSQMAQKLFEYHKILLRNTHGGVNILV